MPIIDKNTLADFDAGSGYNGTGAFRFVEWKPSASITFEANEDYWGGAPHLDGVEYLVIPDAQTRVSQLRSGQLDLLLSIAPRDAEQLESDNRYQLVDQTGVERNWYIGANVQAPGISDVRVRQAIAYAVDNDRILADVYQGYGTVGSLPWPDYSPRTTQTSTTPTPRTSTEPRHWLRKSAPSRSSRSPTRRARATPRPSRRSSRRISPQPGSRPGSSRWTRQPISNT